MTTEDDFHAALDAHPDDWQTRLVFADFLQEKGDPRAEGYRALGAMGLRPDAWGSETYPRGRFYWDAACAHPPKASAIPSDWFCLLPVPCRISHRYPERNTWSRRKVENAAARRFAKLPDVRRAELLAGVPA